MTTDDTAVLHTVDDRDGLAEELAAAAPRRWWNRGTLILGALVLVLAGFLGGLQVQRSYGDTAPAAGAGQNGRAGGYPGGGFGGYGRNGNASAAPGAPGGAAPGGSDQSAAAGTSGTVKLVDGTTIYVQTADGTVVTVKTGTGTSVQTAKKATVKDVRAGDKVTVQGAADAEGAVTATTVTSSGQ